MLETSKMNIRTPVTGRGEIGNPTKPPGVRTEWRATTKEGRLRLGSLGGEVSSFLRRAASRERKGGRKKEALGTGDSGGGSSVKKMR